MNFSDRDWTTFGGYESTKRMVAQRRDEPLAKLAITILTVVVTFLILSTIG